MTPTDAQIEAAAEAIHKVNEVSIGLRFTDLVQEMAKAALAAAAEDYIPREMTIIKNETIECCAQVVKEKWEQFENVGDVVAAIRALKDE
jgi:hypothetical protein